MKEQHKKLCRQKLFVVTGPSRMGKSEYLKAKLRRTSTGGPCEVLTVNVMSVLDPDLKPYRCLKHGSILFDEGSPDLVQRHRDLFQAPRHDITLGNSATSCYTYSVNLWRVRLVLTANGWYDQLAELKPADREWVIANTVVLSVTEPMWVDAGSGRERSAPPAAKSCASSSQAGDVPANLASAGA